MKKFLKIWMLSFLAWEVVALFYKDEDFNNKFKNAKWFDKCRILFSSLLDLNKKLFFDIKSVDYKSKVDNLISRIESERRKLEEKVDFIISNIDSFKKEKLDKLVEELNNKLDSLKDQVVMKVDDIKAKYDLENKISSLKDKIEKIKSKFYKSNV